MTQTALLPIFEIVDQKYSVEGRLRKYSEVAKWTQAETREVLEAGRNNDSNNRREEICDFFYVAYAGYLWRHKGQSDGSEFLRILESHPSFHRYMRDISDRDLSQALEKFRQRNSYLSDEAFLQKLSTIEDSTLALDEIDLYWNKIKYLKQKGYKSPTYKDYEAIVSHLESGLGDQADILQAFYTSSSDVASLTYIRNCLVEVKMEPLFQTHFLRAITIIPRCIHDYVVHTEMFQAQGLPPLDAFICATLTVNHTEFMTPKVAAGKILLEHGLGLEPFFATFLMYSRSTEPYMLYQGLIRGGIVSEKAQNLTIQYANYMNPEFSEFARRLRTYTTIGNGEKLQKYLGEGGDVEELLLNLYKK